MLNFTKIGGSDVPAIIGASPFKAPIETWQRLALGVRAELPTGSLERVKWGQRLETPVAQAFFEDHEPDRIDEWRAGVSREPADPNWVRYTVDFERPGALLEVKTTSAYARGNWGAAGSDLIPIHYAAQVAWYLFHERQRLRELQDPNWPPPDRCFVAVLIGGQELLTYTVCADDEFGAQLVARIDDWRRRYVLTKIPPPVDESDGYRNYLAEKFSKRSGIIRPAESGEAAALAHYLELTAQKKALEAKIKLAENEIIESIAADDGFEALAESGKVRATYKASRDSARTDWKAARLEMAQEIEPGRFAEILETHTTTTPGSYRLNIKRIKV